MDKDDLLLKDEEINRVVVGDSGYDLMPRNRAIAQAQLKKVVEEIEKCIDCRYYSYEVGDYIIAIPLDAWQEIKKIAGGIV